MDQIHPALLYLMATSLATAAGVLFWITVENMAGYKYRYVLAVSSFVLLSPIGAWVVSWIVRVSMLSGKQGSTPA
mgnify:CR=1 FL=1